MTKSIEAWAVTYEYYYGSTRNTYDWHLRTETFELLERAQEAIGHMQSEVDRYRNISAPIPLVERSLLLEFIGSLTLAEHMGDVRENIDTVLKRLGVKIEYETLSELGDALGDMGVTTLYGSSLEKEPEAGE